jgi:hypothetical protein
MLKANAVLVSVAVLGLALTGCVSVTSDKQVLENTAGITGVDIVSIKNRRQVGVDTFYQAVAKNGDLYNCQYNGGDIASIGIIEQQKCELAKAR